MDGSNELRQLAHLLRQGAQAARNIAKVRSNDATAILKQADHAEEMAKQLDAIADGATNGAPRRDE